MPDDKNSPKKDNLTKLMFGVLVFLGISTLLLGVLKISKTINISGGSDLVDADNFDLSQGLENIELSVEELRASDTDKDGLSDYDELYTYKTSPYLADSDSDGYSDKEEIDGDFDPNCPKGQDCRGTSQPTNNNQQSTDNNGQATGEQATGADSGTTTEIPDELKNLTAAQIRELLLASGEVSQEELDKIDDASLMAAYEEMVKEGNQ